MFRNFGSLSLNRFCLRLELVEEDETLEIIHDVLNSLADLVAIICNGGVYYFGLIRQGGAIGGVLRPIFNFSESRE